MRETSSYWLLAEILWFWYMKNALLKEANVIRPVYNLRHGGSHILPNKGNALRPHTHFIFTSGVWSQGTLPGIEVTNGVSSLLGTPVQTNPNGIPTLIYICAKIPAICQNFNKVITLVNTITVNNADPAHNGLAGKGGFANGNDYYSMRLNKNHWLSNPLWSSR